MKKFLVSTAAFAVAFASQAAFAQEATGTFEVGAAITDYKQSDDLQSGTPVGVYVNASANVALTEALNLNLTAKGEYLDGEGDYFDYYTPTQSGLVGAAVNYDVAGFTVGAFGALGKTDGYDDRLGYEVGGQLAYDFNGIKPFAQIGYADIRVDLNDSGFTGLITRGGIEYGASDDLAFSLDGGYGDSKNFEDEGDDGDYWNIGGKVAYRLTNSIVGTAGYEYREFTANTEDDAHEHAFRLGIAVQFGGKQTARDTFNNLSAQLLPFRAASYGEVLD